MKKSTIMAGIAGAIVMFLLGWAFYAASGIMDSCMTEAGQATSRGEDTNILMIFVGHLISCLAMAMVYSKWARGTHSFGHGAQFGLYIGVAFGIGMNLVWMATANYMTMTGHIYDALFSIVSWAIVGGVFAIVYAKMGDD